jgi:hypothetical protein
VSQALRLRTYLGEITRDGQTWTGTHEPLVDEATFAAAGGTVVRRSSASADHDFVLSGLARCGTCGGAMTGQARAGAKRDTPAYRCRKYGLHSVCDAPALMIAARLEQHVLELWRARMELRAARGHGQDDAAGRLAAAGEAARQADDDVRGWLRDVDMRRMLGDADWRMALEARIAERDAATKQLEQARAQVGHAQLELSVEDVEADPELLRAALRSEVAAVRVRRGRGLPADRVTVEWR